LATFESYDVVVVPFPFSDGPEVKRRPALVVSSAEFHRAHRHAILSMITAAGAGWPSDVALRDWKAADLSVACRVRLKLFTLDSELVIRRIGALSGRDRTGARRALRTSLAIT
jgi:mRNA interferase MazF